MLTPMLMMKSLKLTLAVVALSAITAGVILFITGVIASRDGVVGTSFAAIGLGVVCLVLTDFIEGGGWARGRLRTRLLAVVATASTASRLLVRAMSTESHDRSREGSVEERF